MTNDRFSRRPFDGARRSVFRLRSEIDTESDHGDRKDDVRRVKGEEYPAHRGRFALPTKCLLLTENLIHGFAAVIKDMAELAFHPERVDEVADWTEG